jgi:hypothetical protein
MVVWLVSNRQLQPVHWVAVFTGLSQKRRALAIYCLKHTTVPCVLLLSETTCHTAQHTIGMLKASLNDVRALLHPTCVAITACQPQLSLPGHGMPRLACTALK